MMNQRSVNTTVLGRAARFKALGLDPTPLHNLVENVCSCRNPDCTRPGWHPISPDKTFQSHDHQHNERYFQGKLNLGVSLCRAAIVPLKINKKRRLYFDEMFRVYGCEKTMAVETDEWEIHLFSQTDIYVSAPSLSRRITEGVLLLSTNYAVPMPPSVILTKTGKEEQVRWLHKTKLKPLPKHLALWMKKIVRLR
jgi:hypothetical protein